MTQMERLFLLAGLPSSGKSTLVTQIQAGSLATVTHQLELGDPADWQYLKAPQLIRHSDPLPTRLFLQYPIHRTWRYKQLQGFGGDTLLKILNEAGSLTFASTWVHPSILKRRLRSRQMERFFYTLRRGKLKQAGSHLAVLHNLNTLYSNPAELLGQYEAWFTFCKTYPSKAHWLIDMTNALPTVYPASDWIRVSNMQSPESTSK